MKVEMIIDVAIVVAVVAIFAVNEHQQQQVANACAAARELAVTNRDSAEVDRAGCFKVNLGPNSF